jgi:hypothetical protein
VDEEGWGEWEAEGTEVGVEWGSGLTFARAEVGGWGRDSEARD